MNVIRETVTRFVELSDSSGEEGPLNRGERSNPQNTGSEQSREMAEGEGEARVPPGSSDEEEELTPEAAVARDAELMELECEQLKGLRKLQKGMTTRVYNKLVSAFKHKETRYLSEILDMQKELETKSNELLFTHFEYLNLMRKLKKEISDRDSKYLEDLSKSYKEIKDSINTTPADQYAGVMAPGSNPSQSYPLGGGSVSGGSGLFNVPTPTTSSSKLPTPPSTKKSSLPKKSILKSGRDDSRSRREATSESGGESSGRNTPTHVHSSRKASFYGAVTRGWRVAEPQLAAEPQERFVQTMLSNLPVTDLMREFSGDPREWPEFETNWIDCDARMALAGKGNFFRFMTLKSKLKGEPFNLINSLPPLAESYEVALDLLKRAYDDKTAVVRQLHRDLQNLPRMDSNLRLFYTKVVALHQSIVSLRFRDNEFSQSFLINGVVSKLNSPAQREWAKLTLRKKNPLSVMGHDGTFYDLLKIIEEQVQINALLNDSKEKSESSKPKKDNKNKS